MILSGHNYIGSEHLLLGLLREGEGVAARVLENLGADPTNIRTQASIMPSFTFFPQTSVYMETFSSNLKFDVIYIFYCTGTGYSHGG